MIGKRKAKGRRGGGGGVGRKILCSLTSALPELSPFPVFKGKL